MAGICPPNPSIKKKVPIDDYYAGEYEDIWNENDELIGSGVRAIFADFVMNENTRPDLEKAFIIARDQAFKEYDER